MNIDTLVSELEKDHQKKIDKVRKDLAFENWKDRQEHLEFVKSVWACMTIIDPWYVGLFDSCPDEKTILSRLKGICKSDKKMKHIIKKTAKAFLEAYDEEIKDEKIPSVAAKLVKDKEVAEDQRQEAEDKRNELIEHHENELLEVKENVKRAAKLTLETAIGIDTKVQDVFKVKEEVKSEQLEKEKK